MGVHPLALIVLVSRRVAPSFISSGFDFPVCLSLKAFVKFCDAQKALPSNRRPKLRNVKDSQKIQRVVHLSLREMCAEEQGVCNLSSDGGRRSTGWPNLET
eukprot:TRINITY_DN6822_c0_g1_i1.p1 TRINITY_DN6822_c0_g1~~TRINITY_DN6822_c0_g1_i1.p1  ORF type:complete len:101 (+),score=4.78 TRINITY_DN6822_c0_g1_i1:171-473(+)